MAIAIKDFDPSIKIIAPEYTHCLPRVYKLLFAPTSSCSSCYIGGTNSKGLPYVDFMSFHFYGPDFDPGADPPNVSPATASWTPFHVYANIEKYTKGKWESSNSARRYRGALRYMRELCFLVNNARFSQNSQIPKIGFMVTEMNSGHKNSATTSTNASTAAGGLDAVSMLGAQNLVRMYALAMEYGAASVMMWSVKEGGNYVDRGYLTPGNSADRRPSWFHYKMISDYFNGTFYRG